MGWDVSWQIKAAYEVAAVVSLHVVAWKLTIIINVHLLASMVFNSTISVLLNHISRLDQVSCLSGHNTLNKNKHFCSYFSQFTHFVICYFRGLLHPPGRCATEMLIKQHTHCTGVLSQNLREISLCAQKKVLNLLIWLVKNGSKNSRVAFIFVLSVFCENYIQVLKICCFNYFKGHCSWH